MARPEEIALALILSVLSPRAVVGDADDDVAALVIGGQADGALLALAAGETLGRGLQAMVGGVAHHVGERVLDQVEHLAVELGVGTVHLQLDLLAEFAREIADDAGQLLPGIADRLHARLHDAFLQLGGDVGQPLQRHLELGVLVATGDLQQLVAGQHQLGDHGHQMLQRIHVDADRLVGDAVALGGRLVGRRLLRGGLCLGVLGVLRRALGSFLGHRRRRLSGRRGRGRGLYFSFGNGRGGRGFDRGLAEGALELVERHFAQTQRPLQGLVGQRTGGRRGFNGDRCFRHQRRRFGHGSSSDTCGHRRHAVLDHRFQLVDQVAVGALGLGFGRLEPGEDFLDAVDRGQDHRHRLPGHRHAVTEFAHQRLAGMRQRFQARQSEEAAGALDGVDQAEDVIQDLGVVRLLLELHQLIVHRVQALAGFRQKLPQQIIHENRPSYREGAHVT
ncbi:hypothetical protein ACVWW3_008221 [Bradyrhizobium sp. LM2.9]